MIGTAAKKLFGLLDGHVEDVGDRLALELHLQRLAIVALALADVAGDVDVGQEVHLDLDDAVALAGLAAAALDVEGEAAGLVAARLGLGQAGEPFADRGEGAGVGGRVGARRAADRRLVDVDDLVETFEALDALVRGRVLAGAVEAAGDGLVERVDEERRLAAAGDAGDAGEEAERDLGGDVLQIVAGGADDAEHLALLRRPAEDRHLDRARAGEILAGERFRVGDDLRRRALGDDLAAMDAGGRADVDDIVGLADRVLVVLDDDDGVAEVAEVAERVEEAGIVALVEADRGLVEDVEDAGQAGADLRGEADALALAAGERAGGAGEGQVVEPDIDEELQALADLLQDARGDLVLLWRQRRRAGRRTRPWPCGSTSRRPRRCGGRRA